MREGLCGLDEGGLRLLEAVLCVAVTPHEDVALMQFAHWEEKLVELPGCDGGQRVFSSRNCPAVSGSARARWLWWLCITCCTSAEVARLTLSCFHSALI